jgi:hypothetical protein
MRAYRPDIDEPSKRHGDTLCNVVNAYHAMSIDDDREWIFTPLPLTRSHLAPSTCENSKSASKVLREVWFAGAHSDVGGGYPDTQLSGVSLNWMISQLASSGLLDDQRTTADTSAPLRVREDVYGTSHDPEAGQWSPLYHRMNRDLAGYALDYVPPDAQPRPGTTTEKGRICVHESVFQRRTLAHPKAHENRQLALVKPGIACLRPNKEAFDGRLQEVPAEKGKCQEALTLQVLVDNGKACEMRGGTK